MSVRPYDPSLLKYASHQKTSREVANKHERLHMHTPTELRLRHSSSADSARSASILNGVHTIFVVAEVTHGLVITQVHIEHVVILDTIELIPTP